MNPMYGLIDLGGPELLRPVTSPARPGPPRPRRRSTVRSRNRRPPLLSRLLLHAGFRLVEAGLFLSAFPAAGRDRASCTATGRGLPS